MDVERSHYIPVLWSVTAGAIPPGLTLNPDSGTGGIYMCVSDCQGDSWCRGDVKGVRWALVHYARLRQRH